ncbi:hypothetical protein AB833_22320 [Chromatiales bacterium (ex Bugula neritina AB1)]|nr:hypothetical protein AB833_22320 [Chromatiales bacterium (ex Bugula neritina AB1)]
MQKPPDSVSISGNSLARLFPFYLLVSTDNIPVLLSCGNAIAKSLCASATGQSLFKEFEFKRPRLKANTIADISKHLDRLVILKHNREDISLRGQFVRNTDNTLLFLGSLFISASDSLQTSGHTLRDFAPFDNAPEILILHKFREMQLSDLNRNKEELIKTIQSRDDYSQRANTDVLTGIANRRGFLEHCKDHLDSPVADKQTAVLLLDLDSFKTINDTFGHDAGDAVLCATADRLKRILDKLGHAGRLGGDEFAAIVTFDHRTNIEAFIQRVRYALIQPVNYQHNLLRTGLSIGVAIAENRENTESLLHKADIAMYAGRKHSSGGITWYSSKLQADINYQKALEKALTEAIENRDITPHYQPIINLGTHALASFETLARWRHVTLGQITPVVFIEAAEHLGLLENLDWMMIEQALDQLQQWHDNGISHSLHVNISAPTLTDSLPEILQDHLERRNIEPRALILELTETSLVGDTRKTMTILERVTDIGVGLQLDDFGTGYSALTHLLQFPVTGVKIDRSYVHAADESPKARRLLKALIDMTNTLGISTVGEGIETQQQQQMLEDCGCHYGQGYYLGKPVPASDINTLLYDQAA